MLMKAIPLNVLATLGFGAPPSGPPAVDGLIALPSPHSVAETMNRLEDALRTRKIAHLRWNHSGLAADADIALRPTELMLFGNPALGSHLFTSRQTSGIDLPLKALSWQDSEGQVWFAYNDPAWIAARHGIDDRSQIIDQMTGVLRMLSDIALGDDAAL